MRINDKVQSKVDNGRSFNKEEDMCEILNKNFQSVILEDSTLEEDEELYVVEKKVEDLYISKYEIR